MLTLALIVLGCCMRQALVDGSQARQRLQLGHEHVAWEEPVLQHFLADGNLHGGDACVTGGSHRHAMLCRHTTFSPSINGNLWGLLGNVA